MSLRLCDNAYLGRAISIMLNSYNEMLYNRTKSGSEIESSKRSYYYYYYLLLFYRKILHTYLLRL